MKDTERFVPNPNELFFGYVRSALRGRTQSIKDLRVLDFGAGTQFPLSLFSTLHPDQAPTIAYEPHADVEALNAYRFNFGGTVWTREFPVGNIFDLIVCHFSLHHVPQSPEEVVATFASLSPQLVAVSDYDYTKATLEEFEQSFSSSLEKKELNEQFGGNIQECFEFHKKMGEEQMTDSLERNGFRITHREYGAEIARHKFFLLGEVY